MGGPTRAGGLRLARGAQHAQFDVADRLGFHTRAHLTGAEARPRETGAAPGGACIQPYRSARSLSQIVRTEPFETPVRQHSPQPGAMGATWPDEIVEGPGSLVTLSDEIVEGPGSLVEAIGL